jgi:hypothetical protein
MYILLADETNRTPSKDAKFFIYGGLLFSLEKLDELDIEIEKIRKSAGYCAGDEFKFDTRSRPSHVTFENSTKAKGQVVDLCLRVGCKFIAHVILHEIIKNQDQEQQVQLAADYVIGRYNQYLIENNGTGLCVVDNLPGKTQFKYLSDKYTYGLTLSYEHKIRLDRIKLFAASCSNASNVSSAMDIVLGSFRYCINNPKNPEAAKIMMKNVMNLMWHEKKEGKIFTIGKGLILRPELEKVPYKYRPDYDELLSNINVLLGAG